ncbi:hypothetical protein P4310_28660 [Bacillus thuringiensis]|uniref:hypothetical protein n=1 Tax=Bacillus thuringiensis TaxID=1428 RepID=UPI000A36B436|nr:hypothetical protein [Bacillus thuringiensis]MED3069404.1 hypothetical protein [Bacillus thuringiensis]OUB36494.1 hypothetical protein BK737_02920 [Bacillus thuringiensis serovar palmanyolensis]
MDSYFYDDYEHGEKQDYFYNYERGEKFDSFFDYDYGERRKKESNTRDNYNFSAPICNFFKILKSGDDVDTLIISGKSHSVDAFVNFDEQTGIVTFVKDNGAVFIVGCNQIDAIIIDN